MNRERVIIEIKNTLVSIDLLEEQFICDLSHCKGACCVEGESGAPLTEGEQEILAEIYPVVSQYMSSEGIDAVETIGWYTYDMDGDCVTPLINGKECAYSYVGENGITYCAIEKAYLEKRITFRKPLSCHLYPVRVTKYTAFDAVNYEQNKICQAACQLGRQNNYPLYKFLREPLIEAFGEEWYDELELVATEWKKNKTPEE